MARNPQIVVEYVAKTTELQAAAAQVGSASSRAGAAARKAFVPATAALGALSIASKKAIDAASALNEQISASGQVFGKSAKNVQAWSKTGAEAFGLSQREALAAANAYGNMFNTVGLGSKQVAGMSKSMVQLAGDMASFHDQDPSEMLNNLRSALSGEAEPLRKFGVLISDASVKAIAYKEGIAKAGSELTEGQKVQARYALIMQQTTKAQGDFARTSGSVANQQRTLAAETENTSAAFGQALLPAMQAVQKLASGIIGVFGGNVTALSVLIGVVGAAAAAIVTINAAMSAWAAITKVVTGLTKAQAAAQLALNVIMRANPIMLVVTALAALGAAFVLAYKHSETFRRIVDAAFDAVKKAAQGAVSWIKQNWPLLLAVLTGPIGLAVAAIARHWDKIEDGARAARDRVRDIWNNFAEFLSGLVERVGNIAGRIANALKIPINAVIGAINAVRIGSQRVHINMPKPIPDINFSTPSIDPFPNIPRLAAGGIVTSPTLAMVGEHGPEAVIPLSRTPAVQVRVYIGDTELKGLVRTEIVDANTGIARTLLAGAAG